MKYQAILFFLLLPFIVYGQIFPEKVYLHTDRDKYISGDTLWAKAYLFDAKNNEEKTNSKVLYISILDSKGSLVLQNKQEIKDAQCSFFIALPNNLTENQYQLVAHTKLMQNLDNDFFFQKTIYVLKPALVSKGENKNQKMVVDFFPEGGSLVENLYSRVAFKAILPNGKGADFEGHIENSEGEILQLIKPDYLGMGTFNFKPASNQSYKAVVNNGTQKLVFDLPKAKSTGFILRTDNVQAKDGIYVEIESTYLEKQILTLLAHQRGQVVFKNGFQDDGKMHKFFLKNDLIPQDGIVHITLFDKKMNPVAERLVFVNQHKNTFSVETNISQSSIEKHQKINLEINTKPNIQLSVAIIDDGQTENDIETPNLESYLLLNSDLKGYIEQPNAYFKLKGNESKYYLDNLMLTQGWRRFVWNKSTDSTFHAEQHLVLGGKAQRFGKNIKNEDIIISIWDEQGLKINTFETDEEGNFSLLGSWKGKLTLIASDKKGRDVSLILNEPFLPKVSRKNEGKYMPTADFINNSLTMHEFGTEKSILLDEVITKAQKIDPLKGDSRRMMYGEPDVSIEITKEMLSGVANIASILEGRIVGIRPGALMEGADDDNPSSNPIPSSSSASNKPSATMYSSSGSKITPSVLILLDGVIIPPTHLSSIPPTMVERVDLLRDVAKTSIYGIRAGPGKVINILTKRGISNSETFEGKMKISARGYEVSREFYSPQYENGKQNSKPDYRATLYWNPNIKTDKDGKATVTFYNSDIAKKFNISIEATDGKGNVGSFSTP